MEDWKKHKQPMPCQEPSVRAANFSEVALGYTEEQAVREAERCLQCKKSPCVGGCPVEIDIPAFIGLMKEADFLGAIRSIKEKNALPAICGRVCPQEDQCEKECVLGKKFEPVAIGRLERFAADYETANADPPHVVRPASTGKRVAVVGSGPSGLTMASDLAKLGHAVTLFEAFHKAGGVLTYGIPEFRLPKTVVQREVEFVLSLGVELRLNEVVGRTITVDELFEEGYDAVYVAVGAGLPWFMHIPGENFNGVYSANEFLTRSNLMKAYEFPSYDTPIKRGKRVAVVGGGNVAMDAARTALRLGAEHVYNIYRRSRTEMPAREEEVANAIEEGIDIQFLTNPVGIRADERGWVRGIECVKMQLGDLDSSGRRRPIPIEGSEDTIDVDVVIMAIGNGANPLLPSATPGLEINGRGYIVTDEETGETSRKGVYAGGDIVTGAATVIQAMGAARKSARAIHTYLLANGK
jgi:glutamate synthase (NADPH/NADH) small chain